MQTEAWLAGIERSARRRGKVMKRVTALLWEGHTLRAIAGKRGTPSLGTLTRWLADDDAFRDTYRRIRCTQKNVMIEEAAPAAGDPDGDKAVARMWLAARTWRIGLQARAIIEEANREGKTRT